MGGLLPPAIDHLTTNQANPEPCTPTLTCCSHSLTSCEARLPRDSESVSRCLGEWGWVLRSVFEVRVSVSCVSRLPPVFLNRSVCPCVPAPPGVYPVSFYRFCTVM